MDYQVPHDDIIEINFQNVFENQIWESQQFQPFLQIRKVLPDVCQRKKCADAFTCVVNS